MGHFLEPAASELFLKLGVRILNKGPKFRVFMKNSIILALVSLAFSGNLFAQNTITSGNWSDPTVWSAGVPAATGTVNASNPITIDQNITITTGTYNFGYNGTSAVSTNLTDVAGTHTLTATSSGGSLIIWAGTTTFGGAASWNNSTIWVK